MANEHNTEYVSQGIGRLPRENREKPNLEALLAIYLRQLQDCEDVAWQLFAERNVDTAIGAQLTIIGKIVGQERNGVTDDDIFRRYVRARISTNKSNGTISDIFTITRLALDDDEVRLVWTQGQIAAGELRLADKAVAVEIADVVSDLLRDAAAAGVRLILVSQAAEDFDMFRFAALAQLDGAQGAGVGSLPTNGISSSFPSDGGTLILDAALAVEESVVYTSHDGTTFALSGTTANAHSDLSGITLDDGEGKGWGDDADADLGGQFANAMV